MQVLDAVTVATGNGEARRWTVPPPSNQMPDFARLPQIVTLFGAEILI